MTLYRLPIYYSLCVQSGFCFLRIYVLVFLHKQIKEYESEVGYGPQHINKGHSIWLDIHTCSKLLQCWTQ
jgi:hypothetical protein